MPVAVHDTRNVLLATTLVANYLDWAISKRRQYRLGVQGALRLLLVLARCILLLLADSISFSTSCTFRLLSICATTVDGLLRAAVTDHQRIIIPEKLVVVDRTIGGHS